MGLLKSPEKRRKDLKTMVMSAALDTLKFKEYLTVDEPPPLFKAPDRTHPVEIFYAQKPELDYVEAAIRTVLMVHRAEVPGDILLFLIGEEEIEHVIRSRSRSTLYLLEALTLLELSPASHFTLLFHPNRKNVYSILHLHHVP
jgi:HrpA-like RNA helicase